MESSPARDQSFRLTRDLCGRYCDGDASSDRVEPKRHTVEVASILRGREVLSSDCENVTSSRVQVRLWGYVGDDDLNFELFHGITDNNSAKFVFDLRQPRSGR